MSDRRHPTGSADARAAVRRRIDADLAERSVIRHAGLVAEWAAADSGALPTPQDARTDVADELEVLCRALGALAAVDPKDVFPREEWWQ